MNAVLSIVIFLSLSRHAVEVVVQWESESHRTTGYYKQY